MDPEDYRARARVEAKAFEDCVEVHSLPAAFHYWSDRWIRPKLEPFGFSNPLEMFELHLARQCARATGTARFISIGAGNCDAELDLAARLAERGCRDFTIECLELNQSMLERGRLAALARGLAGLTRFTAADLNSWRPEGVYDAVIANQSLHHVVQLKRLFTAIRDALAAGGLFLVSDMIGRNGHRRWPETLAIVYEFWRQTPPSYRYNLLLRRYEETFQNYDCSGRGFEGIHAQDILGLLIEQFQFQLFLPFGAAIDPFVDRAFGPHFDMASAWDRDFIDRVHQRDECELASGAVKPTHMLGVLTAAASGAPLLHQPPLTPEFCLRVPDDRADPPPPSNPYAWGSWPHDTQKELAAVCDYLRRAEARIVEIDAAYERAHASFLERTEWAVRLDRDLSDARRLAADRWDAVVERTAWAERLDAHNKTLAEHIRRLEQDNGELAERTGRLSEQLRRVRWAAWLDRAIRRGGLK